MAVEYGFDLQTVQTFGRAYVASKPPEVQALFIGTPYGAIGQPLDVVTRYNTAMALAMKGISADKVTPILIDPEIDASTSDPFMKQNNRKIQGYTWINNILQPAPPLPPGITFGTLTPYDPNNPPKGSIKVSIDLADYPAYVPPPAPPEPVAPVLYVGLLIRDNLYQLTTAAVAAFDAKTLPSQWEENGHTYQLQIVPFLMGPGEVFWEQTA